MRFRNIIICGWACIVIISILSSCADAQSSDDEVGSAIEKLEQGRREEVKQDLPKLSAKYQNNAGVIYLQARVASDGVEAVKLYQSIVDNFPKSEWADDGLYRVYQYYYALGLYQTAELKMRQLKKEYPASQYVAGKPVMQFPAQDEVAVNVPMKDTAAVNGITGQSSEKKNQEVKPIGVHELYSLQVGAFSTVINAEKQKNYFEELGYDVEITNKVRGGRSLYLVWAGNFKTADEARLEAGEVKTKYKIDSIVVERY